ncbi:MAG: hypothetical protein ACLUD9_07505 [Anaerotignum faecicola]|jgi:pantothenate synthetase|uniref:hypothetical protein n=1 Tax=Clostridium sp. MCC345 TaxID=2592645 RepID=UPI003A238837
MVFSGSQALIPTRIDCPYAIAAVEPVSTMQPPVLVAMAVYIGKTRLIDNFIYEG